MQSAIRRNPLTAFFLVVFAGWTIALVPIGPPRVNGAVHESISLAMFPVMSARWVGGDRRRRRQAGRG